MQTDKIKVIRILAYQNLVNYRKPMSISFRESYFLPPHSSVIGMIHTAMGFTEYQPMMVSVQGSFASSFTNMMTTYEFGNLEEKDRHNIEVPCGDSFKGLNRKVSDVQLLTDMYLLLHIAVLKDDCKDEDVQRDETGSLGFQVDEELTEKIAEGLNNPIFYPSLGRWEDGLRIDEVSIVEIKKTSLKHNIPFYMDAYVPCTFNKAQKRKDQRLSASKINLTKSYVINPKTGHRDWKERNDCFYINRGSSLYQDTTVFCDEVEIKTLDKDLRFRWELLNLNEEAIKEMGNKVTIPVFLV